MSEPSPDLAALEVLEIALRNTLAALRGPATDVVGRYSRPGPGCRVSVTSLQALAIHVGQAIAAVAELRVDMEKPGPIPKTSERKRRA